MSRPEDGGAASDAAAGVGAGAAAPSGGALAAAPPPSPRWWPVLVIVALAGAGYLGAVRWGAGKAIGWVGGITIFLLAGLLVWLFALSRLRGRARTATLLGILAVAGGAALVLRIEGYTGDTWPILKLWFQRQKRVDLGESGARVVLVPAPHDAPEAFGPGRRPEFPAVPLARDWSARAPREVWRRELGQGFSGFAVVGDFAFTQTQTGADECVLALRWATGEVCWVRRDPIRFESGLGGDGPRATPTVHDGRVYALGATGLFQCLDAATGARQWAVHLVDDAHGAQPPWGYAASPLVVDDLIVVGPGGPDGWALAAYDRATGALRWHGGGHPAAYSSPILATLAGRRVIAVAERPGLTLYDPASGASLWHGGLEGGENVSQPIALDGDGLFYSKEYGTGARLWRFARGEDGGLTAEVAWRSRRVMKTKFTQPVLWEGRLYGISGGSHVECIDPRTGAALWSERAAVGHGQTIRAGGFLLIVTEQGDLVLGEARPDRWVELARHRLFDARTWNPPVLVGHRLLARNDREAVLVELPVEGE